MKEFIDKAYKIVDSSHILVLRIIERYVEYLYSLGYDSRRFRIQEIIKIQEIEGYNEAVIKLKEELKKLIESLIDKVDAISEEATPKDDLTGWDKTAFLSSIIFGSTYDIRINDIINLLSKEISTHIKASNKAGYSKNQALSSFKKWIASKDKKKAVEAEILKAMESIPGITSLKRASYLFDDMVNRGYHEANIHYWKQAGIKFKVIVAILDDFTCDTCSSLDGQVFEVDERVLPVHGKCRCEEYPL